jgi:hypothetical protein
MDVLIVNSSHWMSEIGARLSPDCDFAVIWYYDHKDRINKISLRSFHDHVDVSEIAKGFSGGGHRKAAGFQISGELCVDDIFDIEGDPESTVDTSQVKEQLKKLKEEIQEKRGPVKEEEFEKLEEQLEKIASAQSSPEEDVEE